MFMDICVIIFLTLFQIPSNLRKQVTSISVHLALLSKAKATYVPKQRGRKEQSKETWKLLDNYRVRGYGPHKRPSSPLIPIASSEDSQAPSGSIIPQNYYQIINYYCYCLYYYQRLKELTENCYTHSDSLLRERTKINIREETKHIGQSSGEYQTRSFQCTLSGTCSSASIYV